MSRLHCIFNFTVKMGLLNEKFGIFAISFFDTDKQIKIFLIIKRRGSTRKPTQPNAYLYYDAPTLV